MTEAKCMLVEKNVFNKNSAEFVDWLFKECGSVWNEALLVSLEQGATEQNCCILHSERQENCRDSSVVEECHLTANGGY